MDPDTSIVVMGVTGAGKSTVGEALAARLGRHFVEGDDFHSEANVDKMRRGVPLDDQDRAPWLATLNELLRRAEHEREPVVLACSALRRRYRERLRAGLDALRFVYLHGPRAELEARVRNRRDHFAPAGLLDSQLATLEEPDPAEALFVALDQPCDRIVDEIADELGCGPQG